MSGAAPSARPDCLALLSGMLDSALAVRLVQLQGLTVHAVYFCSPLYPTAHSARVAADRLGIGLTELDADSSYAEMIRWPQFGRGRALNPCLDCRIYWLQRAKRLMDQLGARMIISGEVLGQKAWGQKRRDLEVVAHHANLTDRLVRPLSAQRLDCTLAEQKGWIDRQQLLGICGPSRRPLVQLARQWGMTDFPRGSAGCALAETLFIPKVHDLWRYEPRPALWDYQLLRVGRHFRWPPRTKLVVGRSHEENQRLAELHVRDDARMHQWISPADVPGPSVLAVGPPDARSEAIAAQLIYRWIHSPTDVLELTVTAPGTLPYRKKYAAERLKEPLPDGLLRV